LPGTQQDLPVLPASGAFIKRWCPNNKGEVDFATSKEELVWMSGIFLSHF
jgi:hypothetical protein